MNDLVNQAQQYNKRLEERLTRLEQGMALMIQILDKVTTFIDSRWDENIQPFYSKSIAELIADLKPTLTECYREGNHADPRD